MSYFNIPACRGDAVRLTFRLAGRKFIDKVVTYEEFLDHEKAASPTGQLPYITLPNGQLLNETIACMFYAGQNSPLMPFELGSSDEESAMTSGRIMQILSFCENIYANWRPYYKVPEAEKAKELPKFAEKNDELFDILDKMISDHQGGSGFCVNNTVTLADLYVLTLVGYISNMFKVDCELKHRAVARVCHAVRTLPAVADYFAEKGYTY